MNKKLKSVCIPVGCVPPACCPYLPACTAGGRGHVCYQRGVCYWGGCLLPRGCLLLGRVSATNGGVCYLGGVCYPGECLLPRGVSATLLPGGCLLPGVSATRGGGGVCSGDVSKYAIGQTPPCGQTDTCENITFANFVYGR